MMRVQTVQQMIDLCLKMKLETAKVERNVHIHTESAQNCKQKYPPVFFLS